MVYSIRVESITLQVTSSNKTGKVNAASSNSVRLQCTRVSSCDRNRKQKLKIVECHCPVIIDVTICSCKRNNKNIQKKKIKHFHKVKRTDPFTLKNSMILSTDDVGPYKHSPDLLYQRHIYQVKDEGEFWRASSFQWQSGVTCPQILSQRGQVFNEKVSGKISTIFIQHLFRIQKISSHFSFLHPFHNYNFSIN